MLTVLLCFTMDELLNKELTVNSWHNVDSTINCRWRRLGRIKHSSHHTQPINTCYSSTMFLLLSRDIHDVCVGSVNKIVMHNFPIKRHLDELLKVQCLHNNSLRTFLSSFPSLFRFFRMTTHCWRSMDHFLNLIILNTSIFLRLPIHFPVCGAFVLLWLATF